MNTKESFSYSICREQTQMAERELSAFIGAVKKLFGPELAQLSAVDWLDELDLMDIQPGSTGREWRTVTIAASARLAVRLNAGPHDRSFAGRSWFPRCSHHFNCWPQLKERNVR